MKKTTILALAMALGVASSAFAADINDKLEINGEVRANYLSQKAKINGTSRESFLRTRLELVAKPSENLNVVVMAENKHAFREGKKKNRGAYHHDIQLRQAYLKGKIGQADFKIGRFGVGITDGNVLDDDLDRADSVQVGIDVSKKLNVEAFASQTLDGREDEYQNKRRKMYGARATYKPSEPLEVIAEYAQFKNILGEVNGQAFGGKNNIFALTANYECVKDLTASATYIKGNFKGDDDYEASDKQGYVFGLAYRGAEAEEKGSWGLSFNYYNQGGQSYMAHAIDGNTDWVAGFKGWSFGADYAVAKNLVAEVKYYDTKDKGNSGEKDHRVWSALTWSF